MAKAPLLACVVLCAAVVQVHSQPGTEPLNGSNRHELDPPDRRFLLGSWGDLRSRLQEKGVNFDFQYVSDTLWDVKSVQPARAAMCALAGDGSYF